AAFALITLAKRKQMIIIVVVQVHERFEALVTAFKCEIERTFSAKFKVLVAFHNYGLIIIPCLPSALHQQIESALRSVVRDAFVATHSLLNSQQCVCVNYF